MQLLMKRFTSFLIPTHQYLSPKELKVQNNHKCPASDVIWCKVITSLHKYSSAGTTILTLPPTLKRQTSPSHKVKGHSSTHTLRSIWAQPSLLALYYNSRKRYNKSFPPCMSKTTTKDKATSSVTSAIAKSGQHDKTSATTLLSRGICTISKSICKKNREWKSVNMTDLAVAKANEDWHDHFVQWT